MVKLTFCIRRLPDLSAEDFHRYWRERHGPLVVRHAEALRIRRYVQTHAIEEALSEGLRTSRTSAEPFDGIAELWWDDVEDLAEAVNTPAGRTASEELLEDEQRFIDHARSTLWLNEEQVLLAVVP